MIGKWNGKYILLMPLYTDNLYINIYNFRKFQLNARVLRKYVMSLHP